MPVPVPYDIFSMGAAAAAGGLPSDILFMGAAAAAGADRGTIRLGLYIIQCHNTESNLLQEHFKYLVTFCAGQYKMKQFKLTNNFFFENKQLKADLE